MARCVLHEQCTDSPARLAGVQPPPVSHRRALIRLALATQVRRETGICACLKILFLQLFIASSLTKCVWTKYWRYIFTPYSCVYICIYTYTQAYIHTNVCGTGTFLFNNSSKYRAYIVTMSKLFWKTITKVNASDGRATHSVYIHYIYVHKYTPYTVSTRTHIQSYTSIHNYIYTYMHKQLSKHPHTHTCT